MSKTTRTALLLALVCVLTLLTETVIEAAEQPPTAAGLRVPTAPQGWEVLASIRL